MQFMSCRSSLLSMLIASTFSIGVKMSSAVLPENLSTPCRILASLRQVSKANRFKADWLSAW